MEAHFKTKGKDVTHETIEEFAWETLNSGKVCNTDAHVDNTVVLFYVTLFRAHVDYIAFVTGHCVVGCV